MEKRARSGTEIMRERERVRERECEGVCERER
jgi:hypothetical protein